MQDTDERQPRGGVRELEQQLIAMGNMVESLFADSVVALIENSPALVSQMREEDCRAHERWLEIDKLCIALIRRAQLEADQVRFIWAVARIATDLKRTADESLRIGESLRSCASNSASPPRPLVFVPRMAELTQSMLGDAIAAFVNRDPKEAASAHLVFRELAALSGQAVKELTDGMTSGEVPIAVGATWLGVAQRLERIGDEVLDICNQVNHLYRHDPKR